MFPDNGWRCPACQNVTVAMPKDYFCFCGKVMRPEWDRNDTAHSCGEVSIEMEDWFVVNVPSVHVVPIMINYNITHILFWKHSFAISFGTCDEMWKHTVRMHEAIPE